MEPFTPIPPDWTTTAVHAVQFSCPTCGAASGAAEAVWINRRSPVYTYNHQRKWQEFYRCECGTAWWAWSSDRPPNSWSRPEETDPWSEADIEPLDLNTPFDFPGGDSL